MPQQIDDHMMYVDEFPKWETNCARALANLSLS